MLEATWLPTSHLVALRRVLPELALTEGGGRRGGGTGGAEENAVGKGVGAMASPLQMGTSPQLHQKGMEEFGEVHRGG